jgi:hypothetical protein
MNDAESRQRERETTIASDANEALTAPTFFAERAAKISCCAGLAVYIFGGALSQSPPLDMSVPVVNLTAFVLGIVGIIGGARRRSRRAIRMGALGAVLSGLPLLAYSFWW